MFDINNLDVVLDLDDDWSTGENKSSGPSFEICFHRFNASQQYLLPHSGFFRFLENPDKYTQIISYKSSSCRIPRSIGRALQLL